jgi:hypothetical protein
MLAGVAAMPTSRQQNKSKSLRINTVWPTPHSNSKSTGLFRATTWQITEHFALEIWPFSGLITCHWLPHTLPACSSVYSVYYNKYLLLKLSLHATRSNIPNVLHNCVYSRYVKCIVYRLTKLSEKVNHLFITNYVLPILERSYWVIFMNSPSPLLMHIVFTLLMR